MRSSNAVGEVCRARKLLKSLGLGLYRHMVSAPRDAAPPTRRPIIWLVSLGPDTDKDAERQGSYIARTLICSPQEQFGFIAKILDIQVTCTGPWIRGTFRNLITQACRSEAIGIQIAIYRKEVRDASWPFWVLI